MSGAPLEAPAGSDTDDRRAYWRAVLIGLLLATAVLSALSLHDIRIWRFYDPDDAMRLTQVQDWLAGQSWWDVSQHRLGAGTIFDMHWSRLVDIPIAGVITALTPLIGAEAATVAALVMVPFLILFCTMALVAAVTLRLANMEQARIAILLVPISGPLVAQMQPMRIDHHGWQIVLALAATVAVATRPTLRGGVAAGLALAALITISFEGLPFALATVAIVAIAWALDPRRKAQAVALIATLAAATAALHVATRGPNMWRAACDAVAPSWLGALILAALAFAVVTALPLRSRVARLGSLALPGAVSAASLWLTASDCIRGGPFGMLDPFIHRWWFEQIAEGLPFWRQTPMLVFLTFAMPTLGMAGSILSLRRATGEIRAAWWLMIALQGAALVLGLLVLRAGGAANALAVPGAAALVGAALERARAIKPLLPRLLATLGAFALAAPSLVFVLVLVLWPDRESESAAAPVAKSAVRECRFNGDVGALAELPPSRLFAPLDIGPELLVRTRHQAVASGYHRNNARMHLVMASFMGSPEAARRAVAATGAAYVAGCPGLSETILYNRVAPNGFWARLERGEKFDWLEPVPIAGSPVLAWRVR